MHSSIAANWNLIVAASVRVTGEDTRRYRREAERGTLVRLRRGVYMETATWNGLSERERQVQRLRAYAVSSHGRPIFCHQSAAVLHDLPLYSPPNHVHVATATPSGGRSDGDIRRHLVTTTEEDVIELDGLLTVTAPLAVALLAADLPFRSAVITADALLRRDPLLSGDMVSRTLPGVRAFRKASRVLNFASPLAESPGESLSRAVIHELGLPAPVLQHPFFDRRGRIGVVDFWWPEHRLIGEFDGRVKYTGVFGPGDEALWREKKREDRLRAVGPRMTRWTWETADSPARLLGQLTAAGLPRPVSAGGTDRSRW